MDKQIIIDGKEIKCPCYIDRPLYRYNEGCLIQSQAFSEQQTQEKPILRCDEIKNCPIKEQYVKLKSKEQECEELEYDYQKQLKNTNKWIAECENIQKQLDQLKAENEKLKEENKSLKESLKLISQTLNHTLQSEVDLYKRQIDNSVPDDWEYEEVLALVEEYIGKLKAENEKLKEEKQGLIKDWEEKKNLGYEIACKNEKLKQTLTEIKEIAKNGCYDDCGMPLDELSIILQKISEVEK